MDKSKLADKAVGQIYGYGLITGLRKGELEQLQWGDIHFDSNLPYIKARASTTKNRKDANQPIPPALAETFAAFYDGQKKAERGFSSLSSKVVARDIKAAGIEKINDQGKRVDFHSLRYTYCSFMFATDVNPRIAKELMRHSDIKLTTNLYADAGLLPLAETVHRLPMAASVYHFVSEQGAKGGNESQRGVKTDNQGFYGMTANKGKKVTESHNREQKESGAAIRSRT
ncbi:MAG: tyrosine-type recombinase/integrase [Pontiellaceae bacterium]|nr:tyrosine-type recombinase/integrase [Pontiellaceae bacterium]MBN2786310.1 tyrosine-type recombinase/integrase [Pontiellaceae bacterium]